MPELADVTYSREETIAAVSDYYNFLTTLYLKDSQVHYPPAGGWPSITNADPDVLASLGKTHEVLALLAHLPYIRQPWGWWHKAEGAPGCFFADWEHDIASLTSGKGVGGDGEGLRIVTEGVPFCEFAPPHVVGLTNGDRENPIMVLDTKLGIIHWEDCPWRIQHDYSSTAVFYDPPDEDEDDEDEDGEDEDGQDENGDEDKDEDHDNHANHNDNDKRDAAARKQEVEWRRDAPAWTPPDFFEVLKDQFRKLQWILLDVSCDDDSMVPVVRDIYHQHGWPDLARYRKSECLEAVNRVLKERYPSYIDPRWDKI